MRIGRANFGGMVVAAIVVILALKDQAALQGAHTRSEAIMAIREVPAELLAARPELPPGFTSLGYYYHRVAETPIDVWRSHGEFVLYTGTSSDTSYLVLDGEELAALGGAEVPWRYRLPAGLILILGAIDFFVITQRRWPLWVPLAVGAVQLGIAIWMWIVGLSWELVVPGMLATHHILGSLVNAAPAADAAPAEPEARPARPSTAAEPPRSSPPRIHTDPFRSPPQQPILATRVPERATPTPVVHDDASEKPTLLT